MTTREIKLKLTLDNAQFLAAAGATGSSAQGMSQAISGGAGAAATALTRMTGAARAAGDAAEQGARLAAAALTAQQMAAEAAARARQQMAVAEIEATARQTAAAQAAASVRAQSAQAEAALATERLRAAQATAAQTSGMAGLVQQERQVIPLRQAAEAAQRALTAAQHAETDALAQTLNAQRALNAARAAAPAAVRGSSTVSAAVASASAVVSSGASRSAVTASAGISADAAAAAQRLGLVERAAQSAGAAVQAAGQQGAAGLRATASAAQGARDGVASVDAAGRQITFGDIARGAAVFSIIESGARSASSAILSIPTQGIKFVADTEVAQLGMAGILQSMVEINGAAPSFAQAQDMSAGAVTRLQKAAAETAASSNDLITTYRAILGPALAAGMSMQQVERFTIVGANAVKSMGLSTGQMVQELRDLTQGGITAAGSTLATALGLKDADIAKAKNSSEGLFSFLMARMQGFASTSDAYTQTLQGGWEALGEQMTQASAQAMAPAAEAAKGAIAQISEALKGDQVKSALDGMGQGVATLINGMAAGAGMVQQYGGAIAALAAAVGLVKLGGLVGDISAATGAKLQAISASRLAAAQSAIETGASDAVTMSSRQQLAALLAEQRAKVELLVQEQALTAAKLRSAEASAAQMVGMQRLHAVETQVLPLRQQHAQQTAALEQAQQRLSAATTAASGASRAMGAVVGALGGPIGIAITAIGLLTMGLMSARAEAEKLGKTKLSVDRVEEVLAKGGKVDQADAGRVQSALGEAKEKRDTLLVETRKPASMSDRSRGLFGGSSNVEKRAAELAQSEADVMRLEALAGRIDAAQGKSAGAMVGAVNLRSGVSSKGLDELLGDVKTTAMIKDAGESRLKTLDKLAASERALMLKRGATAAELSKFDDKVSGARSGIQRDMTLELQGLAGKAAKAAKGPGVPEGESQASQIEKASAELRMSQLRSASQDRVRLLDAEQGAADQVHAKGLTGVTEYEGERVRIQRAKLSERLGLIDAEIAAEESRKPPKQADQIHVKKRVTELKSDRSGVVAEIASADTGAATATAARDLERQRSIAAETAQVWQDANQQLLQLRQANTSTVLGMINDPAERIRAETATQVAALRDAATRLTDKLQMQISLTTDPGQVSMLQGQIDGIAGETARAVELANAGMTERLKPSWQTMVEGWGNSQKLMRDASDQTMQTMLKGGEDAFAKFVTTGKLSVKDLAQTLVADMARVQFRNLIGGSGAGGVGMLAGLLGAGASKLAGTSLQADQAGPVMPSAIAQERAAETISAGADGAATGLSAAGTEANVLKGTLAAAGNSITGFGGDIMRAGSLMISMMQTSGAAAGNGLGGALIAGVKAVFGGGGGDFVGPMPQANAAGGVFTGATRFAAGGSFTNSVIDRETNFRYRDGGREKLGLMGEAGPEAIMPLSGGGAQAIGSDGRRLGNLPVTRGPGGRLSVVMSAMQAPAAAAAAMPATRQFADGGVFSGGSGIAAAATSGAASRQAPSLQISAPVNVSIMDMGQVQIMINQALSASRRDLSAKLKTTLGVTI